MENQYLNQIATISFSIHSNKGVYALLVGSGISKSSGVLTGWEIVSDLIHKLAVLKKEDCKPDPFSWYQNKFGKSAEYSEILNEVSATQSERLNLLRQYFEPTETELEEGSKRPSLAHTAIAKMAAKGYFKVIVTTNFDRLLEQALDAEGVSPTIIHSEDSIDGAMPLIHSRITLIKVNGDYLDSRLRNTADELTGYGPKMEALLRSIFNDFGLVVCGWSGQWDIGLTTLIKNSPNRRFSSYWTYRSEITNGYQSLVDNRGGKAISIKEANRFFSDLLENLEALEQYESQSPQSIQLIIARTKKYLSEPKYRIQLHDFVHQVADECSQAFSDEFNQYALNNPSVSGQEVKSRLQRYHNKLQAIIEMVIYGCYWGERENKDIWANVLSRFLILPSANGGYKAWLKLRQFPSLLLFYSGGIASVISGRYFNYKALAYTEVPDDFRRTGPYVENIFPGAVVEKDVANLIPGMENHFTPTNDFIFDLLRPHFKKLVPSDKKYEEAFDKFEYLSSLCFTLQHVNSGAEEWSPFGRYNWKSRHDPQSPIVMTPAEIQIQGNKWPPTQDGLFQGDIEVAKKCIEKMNAFQGRVGFH